VLILSKLRKSDVKRAVTAFLATFCIADVWIFGAGSARPVRLIENKKIAS
jgi:hypothetical protein